MNFIRLRIDVTGDAGKDTEIARSGMTIQTLTPHAIMGSAVDREVLRIMIKRGRLPCCLRMTGRTIGGELQRGMWRINRLVVVLLVASRTGIGRIVIIPVMAGGTLVGNHRVRAVEGIKFIMVVKRCRGPSRIRGMTGGAISR